MWDFLTSDTAPWWTGLLGVVIGAVSGLIGTRAADRRRFEREDRRRFDDDIRSVHLRFYRAAARFTRREDLTWSDDAERNVKVEALASSLAAMSDAIAELNIVADNAILEKASETFGIAHDVKAAVEEGEEVTPPLLEAVDHSLHRLVVQMRASLRLTENEKVIEGM